MSTINQSLSTTVDESEETVEKLADDIEYFLTESNGPESAGKIKGYLDVYQKISTRYTKDDVKKVSEALLYMERNDIIKKDFRFGAEGPEPAYSLKDSI